MLIGIRIDSSFLKTMPPHQLTEPEIFWWL
jgi:hypothetical protein